MGVRLPPRTDPVDAVFAGGVAVAARGRFALIPDRSVCVVSVVAVAAAVSVFNESVGTCAVSFLLSPGHARATPRSGTSASRFITMFMSFPSSRSRLYLRPLARAVTRLCGPAQAASRREAIQMRHCLLHAAQVAGEHWTDLGGRDCLLSAHMPDHSLERRRVEPGIFGHRATHSEVVH